MKRVVLLDRDGVINRDLPHGVLSEDELVLEPSAVPAIAALCAAGVAVAVCTNQAAVGRGDLTADTLQRMHGRLDREVAAAGGRIAGWFVCTHGPAVRCACRKPAPGLLEQARRALAFDPQTTWFVGDAERDVEAAEAAGCQPALVLTGQGQAAAAARPDVPCFSDLAAFAAAYLSRERA